MGCMVLTLGVRGTHTREGRGHAQGITGYPRPGAVGYSHSGELWGARTQEGCGVPTPRGSWDTHALAVLSHRGPRSALPETVAVHGQLRTVYPGSALRCPDGHSNKPNPLPDLSGPPLESSQLPRVFCVHLLAAQAAGGAGRTALRRARVWRTRPRGRAGPTPREQGPALLPSSEGWETDLSKLCQGDAGRPGRRGPPGDNGAKGSKASAPGGSLLSRGSQTAAAPAGTEQGAQEGPVLCARCRVTGAPHTHPTAAGLWSEDTQRGRSLPWLTCLLSAGVSRQQRGPRKSRCERSQGRAWPPRTQRRACEFTLLPHRPLGPRGQWRPAGVGCSLWVRPAHPAPPAGAPPTACLGPLCALHPPAAPRVPLAPWRNRPPAVALRQGQTPAGQAPLPGDGPGVPTVPSQRDTPRAEPSRRRAPCGSLTVTPPSCPLRSTAGRMGPGPSLALRGDTSRGLASPRSEQSDRADGWSKLGPSHIN